MTSRRPRLIAAFVLALMSFAATPVLAAEAPAGQMTWALHFSLAPTLFEPAETAGLITPFLILYALHDALVKPMPERTMAPSLAESWSTSPDGLAYEFVLRRGATFHNGEPVTSEDVKEQASELEPKKREALLHRIQQLIHEKVMVLPIWQLALLQGVGPRVAESGFGLIADYPWSAPYEEVKLKAK